MLSKILFKNSAKIILSVRNNPLKSSYRPFIKHLYPRADKIVVQTKKIGKILNEEFSIDNKTVIPNMIDLSKIRNLEKEKVNEEHKDIFDNDFIFINVGRPRIQKGHWYLLRSFKKVLKEEKYSDSKLIVLGKGYLKSKLVKMAKKMDIKNKVFFLGNVENVFPYLKNSDCFAFTSIYEGFPNVLLEALSQNLPIISTDCVSGPREILCPEVELGDEIEYPYFGENGILTKPFENKVFFKTLDEKQLMKEEEMFAEQMIRMYEERDLRKKYSYGSERIKNFDVDKIVDEWEKLL